MLLDHTMLFLAAVFSIFWLPHVVFADGNLASMGFAYQRFMPSDSPADSPAVPPEIDLLIVHLTGVFGAIGMALNGMLIAFALFCYDDRAKRLALGSHLCAQAFTTCVNYAKPPGTGADGSPSSGPLPLMLSLIAIGAFGLVFGTSSAVPSPTGRATAAAASTPPVAQASGGAGQATRQANRDATLQDLAGVWQIESREGKFDEYTKRLGWPALLRWIVNVGSGYKSPPPQVFLVRDGVLHTQDEDGKQGDSWPLGVDQPWTNPFTKREVRRSITFTGGVLKQTQPGFSTGATADIRYFRCGDRLVEENRITTSGLKWEAIGTNRPTSGRVCLWGPLVQALRRQTEFTADEFEKLGMNEVLQADSFVEVDGTFYRPAPDDTVHYCKIMYLVRASTEGVQLVAQ